MQNEAATPQTNDIPYDAGPQVASKSAYRWQQTFVFFAGTLSILMVARLFFNPIVGDDHYTFLAYHLARGDLTVDTLPPGYSDVAVWQGHKYLPFGVLPGIITIPFLPIIALTGNGDDAWIGAIFTALNIWLLRKVLGQAGVVGERRNWALLLFFGGTVYAFRDLTEEQLTALEGFGEISARNLLSEIERSKQVPVVVDYGGGSAELESAGLQIKYVPRDGGNTFSGQAMFSYSAPSFVSSNISDELLALYREHRGNRAVTTVIYTHSHVDHFGGARGVLTEAQAEARDLPILAPAGNSSVSVSSTVSMSSEPVAMSGANAAPMPTRHPRSTWQPCSVTLCPTVTSSSRMVACVPFETWMTVPS